MIVLTTTQRTPEWFLARAGRLTGSRAEHMLARGKAGGESEGRRKLRLQLVVERLTGEPHAPTFESDDMRRGSDVEPDAFDAYEAATGLIPDAVGFLGHDVLLAGCSPDGLVAGGTGLLELKCPKSTTHFEYLHDGVVPTKYLKQIRHNLWITGAEWADFVSFDPRMPPELRLFRHRVTRVADEIAVYEQLARAFLAEVDREVAAAAVMRGAA